MLSVAGVSAEPLPGLDELLGLEDAGEVDDTQHDRDLERKLTAREAAEALQRAVQLMDDAAERLSTPEGAGLVTQRLQEDIIRKLDMIIDSAKKNNRSSSGSPSGASSRRGQQARPAHQQSGGQQSSGRGDNTGQVGTPAPQEAVLGPDTLMDPASWGALPDRLRDALQQGVSGTFSSAYRRLTEAYYKKLAEQAGGER
ncbi:MAG TPA: hypothetical protein ENK11_08815 [Phycisphaerales bacterium]|nr:hypothetical protein [Phycisphaerales bacterium]